MGQLNYNTLRPFTKAKKGFPFCLQPNPETNGKIKQNTFQYQPSDTPNFWKDGGNLQDYTEDEYMYTVNKHNFRGNEFVIKPNTIMTAVCSHTYGIGVRDSEVWGSRLADMFNTYHINLGVGGIGIDTTAMLIKQCFEEELIPNTLLVLWPSKERKMLVGNKERQIDDQVLDFITEEQVDPFIYQFAPGNTSIDKQADVLFKAHLLHSKQQSLLEFWTWRELVIQLCVYHEVKLIEGFVQSEMLEYVKNKCNKNVPRLPNSIDYLRHTEWDFARDNIHFGKYGHEQLANMFAKIIR